MKNIYRNKKFRITLRQKVIMCIFLMYAILVSYFLYFTIIDQHHAAEEEIINAAKTKLNLISIVSSTRVLNEDKMFLQEFVTGALESRDIEYLLIADRQGNVLAEGGRQQGHTLHQEKFERDWGGLLRGNVRLDHVVNMEPGGPVVQEIGEAEGLLHTSGHLFYICAPIVYKGKDVGEIHIGINTLEVNRRLAKSTYRGITVFIVTLLAGALLMFFLDRRLKGSLKNLIQITGQMANGDLTQRVRIDIGDEVEELGKSFNRMARALAEKEHELITARNTMVSMFNGITAGIAYISRDYEIIHANQAYEVLLKEIAGSSLVNELKCFELFRQGQDVCKDCPGRSAMKTGKSKELEKKIIKRST